MEETKIEQKSESEQIIKRIDNKINSLYRVLDIVYSSNLKQEKAKEGKGSKLLNDLQNTEERITDLLDGIRI